MWSRICTTWPENPHCGNCGVPFMNSTTSLPFTSLSMNCSMLMFRLTLPFGWPLARKSVDLRYMVPRGRCHPIPARAGLALRRARLQRQSVQDAPHLPLQGLVDELVLLHARLALERG